MILDLLAGNDRQWQEQLAGHDPDRREGAAR
jgi:hypothetical protein